MPHSYVKSRLILTTAIESYSFLLFLKIVSVGNFGKGLLPCVMRMKVSTVSHLNRSKLSWKLWS